MFVETTIPERVRAPEATPDVTEEILRGVRRRIRRHENWTQGRYARNKAGVPVRAGGPDATQWCLVGAFSAEAAVAGSNGDGAWSLLTKAVGEVSPGASLVEFNDRERFLGSQHRRVLAVLDRAIGLATEGG